jgi:hypothetical protein
MDMGLFDVVFFTQGVMIVIPLRNIFIQVQYLIIFGFQKNLDFLTVLRNYPCAWMYFPWHESLVPYRRFCVYVYQLVVAKPVISSSMLTLTWRITFWNVWHRRNLLDLGQICNGIQWVQLKDFAKCTMTETGTQTLMISSDRTGHTTNISRFTPHCITLQMFSC